MSRTAWDAVRRAAIHMIWRTLQIDVDLARGDIGFGPVGTSKMGSDHRGHNRRWGDRKPNVRADLGFRRRRAFRLTSILSKSTVEPTEASRRIAGPEALIKIESGTGQKGGTEDEE
jgi:hypothetical protein